ncbi:MAG: adenylate/guanylate cyclase domain-containing protein [Bacteroidetes bacterium]|nr:adenylate/guanylate cyclase domain-containing protein [Bacteroidota bacterium]
MTETIPVDLLPVLLKRLVFVMVLVFVSVSCRGITPQVDNLKFLLSDKNSDTARINIYLKLATIYHNSDHFDSALYYAAEASKLAGELHYTNLECKALMILGDIYLRHGELNKSIDYHSSCMKLMDSLSVINREKSQREIALLKLQGDLNQRDMEKGKLVTYLILAVTALLIILLAALLNRFLFLRKIKNQLSEKNHIISLEQKKSEDLLLNILPEETARELKLYSKAKPRKYEKVTVMFTDFKDFSRITEKMDAEDLIREIDYFYKAFDNIIVKYGIEKIKTIGDAYMAVGGLPVPNGTHASDVIDAALEIRQLMQNHKEQRQQAGKSFFEIRIGIHSGPVVSGIVGHKKFAFDIWGDTVNVAYCMESTGAAGRVNISKATMEMVNDMYDFTHRGKIPIKGDRKMDMYFVNYRLDANQELTVANPLR